jgi:hypothetical protein
MLTPNTKCTALDILTEAGIKDAESLFGTTRIRIGGIAGIVKPDHLIRIPTETKTLEVIVGNSVHDVKIRQTRIDIPDVTEAAQLVIEEKGRQATAQAKKLQAAKQK